MDDLSPFQRLENSRTNKFSIQHWPCASSLLDWRLKLFAPWDFVRSHVDRLVRDRWPRSGLKPGFFLLSEVISAKKNIYDFNCWFIWFISSNSLVILWHIWIPQIPGDCYEKISQTERAAAAKPHFECQAPAEPKEPKGGWRFRRWLSWWRQPSTFGWVSLYKASNLYGISLYQM